MVDVIYLILGVLGDVDAVIRPLFLQLLVFRVELLAIDDAVVELVSEPVKLLLRVCYRLLFGFFFLLLLLLEFFLLVFTVLVGDLVVGVARHIVAAF